jgi:hypothetical protein
MCEHTWRKTFEEAIFGGFWFPTGYICTKCNKFVSQHELTPEGISGFATGEAEITGPHGGKGYTSTGEIYSKQIRYRDGTLEIIK